MNIEENELFTNFNEFIGVFIFFDLLILFTVLFSLSVLVENFMIRKIIFKIFHSNTSMFT
jgi:hypothetical protein